MLQDTVTLIRTVDTDILVLVNCSDEVQSRSLAKDYANAPELIFAAQPFEHVLADKSV